MTTLYKVHPTAIVESAQIGDRTTIWAFVHILPGATIGENVNICDHCFIENEVTIGNNVTIKSGVYLWDGITVEDNVIIGPAAVFTNDLQPRSKNANYDKKSTLLKKGTSVGANATILGGVTIGEYAMIGAGSVVTKDVPNFALVYGVPAAVMGHVCVCGSKLNWDNNEAVCSCGKQYKKESKSVLLL